MLEIIIIIAIIVFAIWQTMQEGHIFHRLGVWFENHLPEWMHNPVFACPICLTPWYGSVLYWLIWGNSIFEWIVCVIAAMGLNSVILKLAPADE